MKIAGLSLINKTNIYFGSVSINGNSNGSGNSIEKAKARMKSLDSEFDLRGSRSKRVEIERKIDAEREERLKPWYAQWFQERKINNELVKEETALKVELNKEQEDILTRARMAAEESTRIVEDLEREIAENNRFQAERNAKISGLRIGEYRTQKGFSQIAGYDKEKEILYKYFISEIDKEKRGEKANIPNAILFFGPKGNGKTTFATAFAQEIGCEKPIAARGNGRDVAKTCKSFLNNLYKAANRAKEEYEKTQNRQVIFIDEIDKIANENSTILPELEEFIKTCYEKYHCIVFAITNYPLDLKFDLGDENIFPYIVSQDPPTKENKIKILKYYLQDKLEGDISDKDYEDLAQLLEDKEKEFCARYSIDRIKNVICEADFDNPLTIEKVKENIANPKNIPNINGIMLEDYDMAMSTIMKNIIEG